MAQDSQITESIFDFAYVDRQRIASYFSQLFPNGTLSSIKSAVQTGEQSKQALNASVKIVGGAFEEVEAQSELLERQYDAAWTLPITLADRLDELTFLHRSVKTCPIGQLLLVKGAMQVLDIRMLKDMWEPMLKFLEFQSRASQSSQNRHARRANKDQNNENPPLNQLAGIIKCLPHGLQLNFHIGDLDYLWSTLIPDNMIIPPEDFALKHGSVIPGEWHMLAVLDGRPDLPAEEAALAFAALAQVGGGMTAGLMEMLEGLKNVVGRPSVAYGATPLMIFRAIHPAPSAA